MMLRCGLLGERLVHSYSPAIHAALGDYGYELFEVAPKALGAFLTGGEFDALNVTIPYKKAVIPYCAALTDTAREIGSVNTIVRRADGTLLGGNTDAFGFERTVRRSGASLAGKKALVLGSGGASAMVCAVLRRLGAGEIVVISRSGENNYGNLERHADAAALVNTTPVGMYPGNGTSPVDLRAFPACEAVFDLIYNPARTALLMQAEALGIPHANGLHMLVAQAWRSAEAFTGRSLDPARIDGIERDLARQMRNVVLIGMPGCGKSTVARRLGRALGRETVDADALVAERAGMSIPEIFARCGEEGFRARETETLRELGKRSGLVIATGGGCVTREENYAPLHQNGTIVWLRRGLDRLARRGRPLSQGADLAAMYAAREPQYRRFADVTVDNDGDFGQTLARIREAIS